MRMLERLASVVQMSALLGPANLISLVLVACVAGLMLGYRLLSQGYHRCFLTIR